MATTPDELVESWINGNRSWVRGKVKNKRRDSKQEIIDYAREVMSPEDYNDFVRNAMF